MEKKIEVTSLGTLTGVSPLPYTKRIEGFVTGIYHEMDENEIPFNFAYMQGAKNRAKGVLENKYNFATMSKASALSIINEYKELIILMEFEAYTYLTGYALMFKDKKYKDKEVIRVGVDSNSPDHVNIIKVIFSDKKVEYVNVQYTRMIPEILKGNIDVSLYNKDVLIDPTVFESIEFEEINLSKEAEDGTRVVFLVNKNEYEISNVLKEIIDVESVTKVMDEVIGGMRIPAY